MVILPSKGNFSQNLEMSVLFLQNLVPKKSRKDFIYVMILI